MGKGAETKKKKKGRPSLLDIQKRLLKQQKLQQSPAESPNSHPDTCSNPSRRSGRRNSNTDWTYPPSESVSAGDGDDDDDERIEKKRRPLLGLDSQSPNFLANDNHEVDLNRRKISVGSDFLGEKVLKVTDTGDVHGSLEVSGPTTPLPDKKLLAFILDRLQKKDTHGVFSEPVDPGELPDYHDIIKHPMDFGTVRMKLDGGAYANLEQFEKDIFLICSNAMQYNAPDTIFFRQARSMQEMAKKDFENLRQDSDGSEPEQPEVARRGRPPGTTSKAQKKFPDKLRTDCVGTEVSSDTVLANGDNSCFPNSYNLRKGPDPCFFLPADSTGSAFRGNLNRENQNSWFSDFEREFPASVLKAVMKEGKKLCPLDENRRDSYKQILVGRELSIFCTFEAEPKHLSVVDLHLEHGYARSLAQFAADLGPVAWKIASRKIESVLPYGTKFGPGWIGENETSECQQFSISSGQNISLPHEHNCKSSPVATAAVHHHVSTGFSLPSEEDAEAFRGLRSQNKLTSKSSPVATVAVHHHVSTGFSLPSEEDAETVRRLRPQNKLTSPSSSTSDVKSEPALQFQQKPITLTNSCSSGERGFFMQTMPAAVPASYELTPPEAPRMVSNGYAVIHPLSANYIDSATNKISESSTGLQPLNSFKLHSTPGELCWSWQAAAMEQKAHRGPISCEPNVRFLVSGSPNSNLISSSQQPDLGLQL